MPIMSSGAPWLIICGRGRAEEGEYISEARHGTAWRALFLHALSACLPACLPVFFLLRLQLPGCLSGMLARRAEY